LKSEKTKGGGTMADNTIGSPAPGWRDGLGRALLRIAVLGLVLFVFWLIADQGIVAAPGLCDDEHFVRRAECGCWFDEENYSQYVLFKEPTYSLFVAGCYRLGLPLRLAHEALYLAAAGFLAWSLVYRQSRAAIGLLVFAAIALQPIHFQILQSALHDAIYSSLLMLATGALLLQFKRRYEPGRWRRWLGSGVALGLLWNTRQEWPLALVLVLVFLAAAAFSEWRRHPTRGAAIRAWVGGWSPSLAVVAVITLALMGANYLRWGVFAVSDLSAPNFKAAYQALLRIRPDHSIPYVPITRDMRERAYAVSPSFRELAPYLEGHLVEDRSVWWSAFQNVPPQEYSGGWFAVVLRDAAAEAGHYQSARETEAYYGRVAEELRAAEAEGRLATRWLPPGLPWAVNPDIDTYLPQLVPSWRALWYCCWSYRLDPSPLPDVEEMPPEIRALFDRVACRRALIPTGPSGQTRVRDWIWTGYIHGMELTLAAACLVAGLVLLLRRTGPGWGMYLLPAGALGGYGLARLAVFTVFDASTFPGADIRYLLPAALSLTITAVWLLAEGLRLLRGAFANNAPGSAGQPVSTPPYSRTRTLLGAFLLLASLLLLLQWGYGKAKPPDFIPQLGVLEGVDGEHISGCARLKEQPDSPVHVEIYDGDTLLATVPADQFRQDCFELHMGDGRKGFSYPTPTRLRDWRPHTIRVKIAGTNVELAGSPKTVILPGDEVAPDKATVGGSLDGADGEYIAGWAWDKNQPDSPIDVDIYEGDGVLTLLATVPATQFRQDLLDAKVGDGRHGFSYPTPARLKDGKAHTIRVITSQGKVELDGSPKAVTLKSP
jgi:hypothetical protein